MKRIGTILGVALVLALAFSLRRGVGAPAGEQPAAAPPPLWGAAPLPNPALPATTAFARPVQTSLAPVPRGPLSLPAEKLLAAATILAERETPARQPQTLTRERLVKTDFKYPLVRVVETVRRDASGGETIQRRELMVADHVMVKLRAPATTAELTAVVKRLGGEVRKKMYTPGMFLVSFAAPTLDTIPEGLRALPQHPLIELAEPDYIGGVADTLPNDTSFGVLWGLHNTGQTIGGQVGIADADIDAPAAWDLSTGNSNIVVAVIDTGVDYNHPDLAANMWRNPGEIAGNGIDDDGNGFIDDVYGWDFGNDDSDPFDDHSHGTHCAGTIGGVGNNSTGVVGVNWRVRIMAVKWILGNGNGATSDATDAITYTTRMRVRLTSNSWHVYSYSAAMEAAIGQAAASNILFVAAAGNAARDLELTPDYPANFTNDNMIVVAATDNRDQLASFSNWGLISVDLGAPGVNVYSSTPGNSYAYFSGTSMACPHVAGACALAYAVKPDATAAEIKQTILAGAEPIAALSNKCVTGARLNVFNTLQRLDRNIALTPFTDTVFSGPDGGPFTPAAITYVIANIGTNTFSWTATKTAPWFDLSLTSGTLAPGQSNSVIVTWNAVANTYPPGAFTDTIIFSNTLSAVPALRVVSLQVLNSLAITPATGFTAVGPEGGPFDPNSQAYILSNRSSAVRSWAGLSSAAWLSVPIGGALPGHAKTNVTVALNATANSLPAGQYTATATFSNLTAGSAQPRPITLRAGVDDFTELFSATDNDLDGMTLTFIPNGSAMYYTACRAPATAFPTDPTGGTTLALSDDSALAITLSGGATVSLYGTNVATFYVGSNGYITLGSGDTTYTESLSAHFSKPRIAALFDDLDPASGGTVSWKQLADRAAVTWQNVPEFGLSNQNSFQIELFFDGRIRITWLAIAATDGLAGLSRGQGLPPGFAESDLTGYGLCAGLIPNLVWLGTVDTNWDTATPNWTGDATTYTEGANVTFKNIGVTLVHSNVTIQPDGVAPAATTITNTTAKTFTFTGGTLGGGPLVKSGAGTASFNGYLDSLTFTNGAFIQGGTVMFRAETNAVPSGTRTQWFGLDPITLDNANFGFLGAAAVNGHTNILPNPLRLGPGGGTLQYGRAGTATNPKIIFSGPVTFATNATLWLRANTSVTGVDANGHELTGPLFLHGTNRLLRVGVVNGVAFSLSGNIVDGAGPATLVISNGATGPAANRNLIIRGTANTYAGGTIICSDNQTNNFNNFFGAVEVAANSTLGTGPVTVQGGGFLRLFGPNNIAATARLELQVDLSQLPEHQTGTVWIAANVTNTVSQLTLGADTFTAGLFTSNSYPAYVTGPGAIRVGGLPVVTVTAPDANAGEWGANPGTFQIARTGGVGENLRVAVAISGTAVNGIDYLPTLNSPVVIPAGSSFVNLTMTPLADALVEGPETVILTIQPDAAYTTGAPGNATITIADPPIDQWRLDKFGANANNPAIAGDLADPEGDGRVNLLEYALHLDPWLADGAGLPAVAVENDRLTLTYVRVKAATDIHYLIEGTGDLTSGWQTNGISIQLLFDDGTVETNKAVDSVPLTDAPHRFLRLHINKP